MNTSILIQVRNRLGGRNGIIQIYLLTLATYLFCYLPLFPVFRGAETVLVLLFFWLIFARPKHPGPMPAIHRDPLFKLSMVLLVFLAANYGWHALTFPEAIDQSSKATRYYLKPLLVLLVAVGLHLAGTKNRWRLMGLALAGFWLYLALNFDSQEWTRALSGGRVDLGIHNAQHTALLFGSALLALLFLLPRALQFKDINAPWVIRTSLIIISILLALLGTVVSQTRAVWIGIAIAITAGILTLLVTTRPKGETPRVVKRNVILYLFLVGTVLSGFVFATTDLSRFGRRLSIVDTQELQVLVNTPTEGADPRTSTAIRLTSWRVALEWIKERPLLGWGAGTTDDLIEQSPYFSDHFKANFGHLHNSFMESLVANGILGSLILLSIVVRIGIAIMRAYRNGNMPLDVFVFAWAYFAFWLCVNQFESYTLYSSGQYLNAVIVGFIYSFCIVNSPKKAKI